MARIINDLKEEIQAKLSDGAQIQSIKKMDTQDNPDLIFSIADKDGDLHELVVRFIQRIEY